VGKPFEQELSKLNETYLYSNKIPIESFRKVVVQSLFQPLISVGSGGSLTSALFASLLHQQTKNIALCSTPLEMLSFGSELSKSSVLFVTAGGRNFDIVNALEYTIKQEPNSLGVLCATKESKVEDITGKYTFTKTFSFELPCGKDGFLATNSLLAFNIILLRGYQNIGGNNYNIPPSIDSLLQPVTCLKTQVNQELDEQLLTVLERQTVIILYGKWSKW